MSIIGQGSKKMLNEKQLLKSNAPTLSIKQCFLGSVTIW